MDTDTVLKIINMLDARIKIAHDTWDMTGDSGALHAKNELKSFQNHLQAYIESQVNQVENEMNRGE